ncbi:MAG: PaaI family thioesterase [Oscillospiraceae bacterium]|nr:PaaI family thioesterase [Oscillospiraceae bacterium]
MKNKRTINPQHISQLIEIANNSPYFSLLGMKITETGTGYAKVELDIDNRHMNLFGSVHGGANASLIDTVTYWAAYCDMDEDAGFTTLDVSVTNLAMAKEGKLTAVATAIKQGRSICLCEAVVKDQNDRIIAHGTSKLLVLQGRQTIADALKVAGYDSLPAKYLD